MSDGIGNTNMTKNIGEKKVVKFGQRFMQSCVLLGFTLLSGCGGIAFLEQDGSGQPQTMLSMMNGDRPATKDMAAVEAALDFTQAAQVEVPTITATGYAAVSAQPARSQTEKRLMAIRAARLSAYRDLTEQIHGMKISAQTTVIDAVVQNDSLRGQVKGVVRGARTVRIYPMGSDTYEVVLEIDRDSIRRILSAARGA